MNRVTRRRFAAVLAAVAALPLPALAAPTRAVLHKNPQCGCCEDYADYLRQNGFAVEVKPTENLDQMSRAAGVPDGLQGCHLTVINGHPIAGHVQISTVRKLLANWPANVAAVTLPGMPPGTPGMPGAKSGPLEILAISKTGGAPVVYDVQ
jgi:hypothetical protein